MPNACSEAILEALDRIDRPGTFCVARSVPAVLPGLMVEGMGHIAFPLLPRQAEELKEHCEQAPYGKGEETLVDTSVRRVWRLTPDRFQLTNPDWQPFLDQAVAAIQEELGLEGEQLNSHLYDLLLYEPGSFFRPHRDGEKVDRMVATMVVVLPSFYQGGELLVRHEGQEQTVDFSTVENAPFRSHFTAFYADCEHEIRPLREGHRLALVYNLALARPNVPLTAPRSSEQVAEIAGILRRWSQDPVAGKLVVTLEHQYTQDGLAWDVLKGTDRAKASVLRQAAREAGCQAHLALLTYWQTGGAEYAGSGHSRRGRGYYEESADDYEMGEIIDSSLTADHWIDPQGNRLALGEMHVDEGELVDPEALTEPEPEEDFEGYTGNAGMTLERWYRHAAILLWPDRRHFEMLCDIGATKLMPALSLLVARWQQAAGEEAEKLKAQCLEFASIMIDRWPENTFVARGAERRPPHELLPLLELLDDTTLIRAFLSKVLVKDVSVDPGEALAEVCAKYGWLTFRPELSNLFASTVRETLLRNARLLEQLCLARGGNEQQRVQLGVLLADELVSALERTDGETKADDWRARELDRAGLLALLAKSLIAIDESALLARVVEHAFATPTWYGLTEAHLAALSDLRPWLEKQVTKPNAGLSKWVAACREKLQARTATPPQKPANLRRPAELTCKCADCSALKMFLQNADEAVYRFRARQDRRSHVEQVIRQNRCDLDCETDRRGSPQTLVCTKNTASFERSLEGYRRDEEHLAMLRALEDGLP